MLLWLAAGLGLLLALVAIGSIRRLRRRLDALSQSYWELRYDYTRLRSQVARLDPGEAREAAIEPADQAAPQGTSVAFVPLATIRRKDKSG